MINRFCQVLANGISYYLSCVFTKSVFQYSRMYSRMELDMYVYNAIICIHIGLFLPKKREQTIFIRLLENN